MYQPQKTILIANRGEIAVRIVRAIRDLGYRSLVVYSEADCDSLAVKLADKAVLIGPAPSRDSYLDPVRIIAAAQSFGADAVHPGYGFLSENASFAQQVVDQGLVWIGPKPETIALMGDKNQARETMQRIGVPITPGSDGSVPNAQAARNIAGQIGYPVLIKASAGGGGRGMREVHRAEDLEDAFDAAVAEAKAAFGNGEVYLEKLVIEPRHVEIQVLCDTYGNATTLCERDCSIQRRHQKLVEEAPSPIMTPELRLKMSHSALRACRAVGYQNAGTIEFLVSADGDFYFMEMNTRVQVEHPITELITNSDIIKAQIEIAFGAQLGLDKEKSLQPFGHAIEFRINAEDPSHGFLPQPGLITGLHIPGGPGVRVDTHIYQGYLVPSTYDSLLAKLIIWGRDRKEAIARARRALAEFEIDGIKTTIPFHQQVLESADFQSGLYNTGFIEHNFSS
ncbi:MAG: acetyl-CoA carboxylase biotin carboxylase subunit [Coriobacteriales bacterium]|jgi:acetyl-CoA carboxylase biotin carboxylase subunit|nr:acetyl-CoA carboxylase biotin carboxylase subunit [Coriobacteriales bacterium]